MKVQKQRKLREEKDYINQKNIIEEDEKIRRYYAGKKKIDEVEDYNKEIIRYKQFVCFLLIICF